MLGTTVFFLDVAVAPMLIGFLLLALAALAVVALIVVAVILIIRAVRKNKNGDGRK